MPSYSQFGKMGPGQAATLLGQDLNLPGPLPLAEIRLNQIAVNPNGAAVPLVQGAVQRIAERWPLAASEAVRRVVIDIFLQELILNYNLDNYLELKTTAVPGYGIAISHGKPDYALAPPANGQNLLQQLANTANGDRLLVAGALPIAQPLFMNTLLIEAKANLRRTRPIQILNVDTIGCDDPTLANWSFQSHQWQLIAELVNYWRMQQQPTPARFIRGILTDGIYWIFYQLNMIQNRVERSPLIVAASTQNQTNIPFTVAMINTFIDHATQPFASVW